MTLLEFAIQGGILMGILFVLSMISVALFIERWIVTKKAMRFEEKTYIEILRSIDRNNCAEAAKICKLSESPFIKTLEQGLSYADSDMHLAQETIEQSGGQFIRGLEKHLNMISTISAVAPLLGFLGTVIGMIRVFMQLLETNDVQALSGGISYALITTVGGLVVGIGCIVFHNLLVSRIETISFMAEEKVNSISQRIRRKTS